MLWKLGINSAKHLMYARFHDKSASTTKGVVQFVH